ncbi:MULTISPECIES: pentapeptide repeat-containing protein [unclassified Luteococcus]|uniref:pentapeptide repeat-containing protein n=1 Tax=unclassified Luteococcus TaxID=2639923 RepID=UPI00313B7BCE
MQSLPRPATAPRLSARHVTLADVAEVGSGRAGSDELVTDLRVGSVALAAHSSEFVELVSLEIGGGSLADSDWYRTTWVDIRLEGVDGANAAFVESGLKRIRWQRCRLVGLTLSGCTLADVAHLDCLLGMANFRFANLTRVEFVDCDLTGADFTNARLTEVGFTDCVLREATFSHASCDRVVLQGGDLSGLRGLDGLRGATVRVDNLADIAQEMATELGLQLIAP